MPTLAPTVPALRALVRGWRAERARVALVPTMGALHAGHLALVDAARAAGADRVVASIFVNPAQFLPGEDLAAYPRPFEADVAALSAAGVDAVFAPSAAEIYPPGFALTLRPGGPALAGLEDAARPGHFDGVATVVAKLLIAAEPDLAAFGEKDWQQLAVVRRLVADLGLPVDILPVPTVREADGLALSSRNAYLSAEERARAPALHRALVAAAGRLAAAEAAPPVLAEARAVLEGEGFAVDYVEARDALTLGEAAPGSPTRLLAAARLGRTRLIDNFAVGAA